MTASGPFLSPSLVASPRTEAPAFELKFTLDEAPSGHLSEQRTLTLPLDHEVSRWLVNGSGERFIAHMTIDDGMTRWTAPLHHWEAKRVGSCPECQHCMQKVVRSIWRIFDPPPPPAAPVLSNR